jgi:hypothetical protein
MPPRAGAFGVVDAVEQQGVEVRVQIEGRAEALGDGDGAGAAALHAEEVAGPVDLLSALAVGVNGTPDTELLQAAVDGWTRTMAWGIDRCRGGNCWDWLDSEVYEHTATGRC